MKFLLIGLLFPLNSYAVFQTIYERYKVSNRLTALKMSEKINEFSHKIDANKYDWTFDVSSSYSDSNLDSLYSFQSQQTISDSLSFGITKSSFKFGTVSLKHSKTNYDLSHWENSEDRFYGYENSLNYSYEFLNDEKKIDWNIINDKNKLREKSYSLNYEKDHHDFFQAYLEAKRSLLLERLYKEFGVKSKKKIAQVKKRVKDGLSRKIELYQSRISYLAHQETILQNANVFNEKVSILEQIVGYEFGQNEYKQVHWTYKPKKRSSFIYNKKKHLEVEILEIQNIIDAMVISGMKENTGQKLAISLGYKKNSISEIREDAFNDSFGSSPRDEKVVSLNYSIPFGDTQNSQYKRKVLARKNKNALDLINKKGEFEVRTKVLDEKIERSYIAYGLIVKKIKLAKSSVKSHQRLYLRGQVSFEELLRSEELLMNSKVAKMNMLFQLESSMGALAFANGNIIKFLDTYLD